MLSSAKLLLAVPLSLCLFQNATPGPEKKAGSAAETSAPPASADSTTTVAPKQPVITVYGICGEGKVKPASAASPCISVMNREQFENLMNALNPGGKAISARGRQNLAQTYAEALALEAAARRSGLEDTNEFQQLMNWSRLRVAADLYRRKLEEKYSTPPQEEVDAYYRQHVASFDRVSISRILLPRQNTSGGDNAEFDKKALEVANTARARAVKGDDIKEVQKDAYSALGLSAPPPVNLGKYGRANFTDKEGADVFSLKPGEISPVEAETRSYVIYKVDAKETLSEEEVKAEISREISQKKFKDAIKAITDQAHAEFDEQYFGAGMNTPLKVPAMPATPPAR